MNTKATPQLEAQRFKQAETERNVWVVTVEEGTTREQILNPAFLSHIAAKLRPYDHIEVRCDDGTFFAELLVLNAERTWAKTHVLEWHDLTTRDVSQTQADQKAEDEITADPLEAYTIQWKGPHKKFCVIRKMDNAFVQEEETSKSSAQRWLDEYLKVVA